MALFFCWKYLRKEIRILYNYHFWGMNLISIIIISYNRVSDTLDLLTDIAQLKNIELLKDVIILNNASADNYASVENFVRTHSGIPFKYIKASENLGVSRGRNYATK